METTKRKYLKAMAALSSVSLGGCVKEGEKMSEDEAEDLLDEVVVGDMGGLKTVRAIDREAGVVLYNCITSQGNGFSALPIEQTDLE